MKKPTEDFLLSTCFAAIVLVASVVRTVWELLASPFRIIYGLWLLLVQVVALVVDSFGVWRKDIKPEGK
jgi:hypothetical protein